MQSLCSRLLSLFAIVLCSGCVHFQEQRFATYPLAMKLARQIPDPPIFHATAVPDDLPGMVIYASLQGDFYEGLNEATQAQQLKKEALKRGFEPDVLIYEPKGAAYAGSTSQYVGFGASFSTPVYRPQAWAYCYRLSPTNIGLGWDANQMVNLVADEVRTSAQIQEGDTLVSINGLSVKRPGQTTAPFENEALRLKVGQQLKLVWIRPGSGRMEGKTTAMSPHPMPEGIDSTAMQAPVQPKASAD